MSLRGAGSFGSASSSFSSSRIASSSSSSLFSSMNLTAAAAKSLLIDGASGNGRLPWFASAVALIMAALLSTFHEKGGALSRKLLRLIGQESACLSNCSSGTSGCPVRTLYLAKPSRRRRISALCRFEMLAYCYIFPGRGVGHTCLTSSSDRCCIGCGRGGIGIGLFCARPSSDGTGPVCSVSGSVTVVAWDVSIAE